MVWFIAPIVIGVIAVLAVVASSTTSSPVNDLPGADAGPTTPANQSSVGGGTVSHTTKPPAPPSYVTAAGVRAALARVQRLAPGSRPVELRIDPKSFVAIVQLPNHSIKLINITPTGSFSAPTGQTGEKPIPVSKINPVVPSRIVAEMNHRFHVPLSRIEYLVAFWFPGFMPEWQVFLKGTHTAYLATLSGAQLHRSA
jgi:hypothetical protein